jgi:hypothetical protein
MNENNASIISVLRELKIDDSQAGQNAWITYPEAWRSFGSLVAMIASSNVMWKVLFSVSIQQLVSVACSRACNV